jgi:hypothetical protein
MSTPKWVEQILEQRELHPNAAIIGPGLVVTEEVGDFLEDCAYAGTKGKFPSKGDGVIVWAVTKGGKRYRLHITEQEA